MSAVDIRRLDFSLLLTLASLLRTRQVTATAAELGVTQSSVSHALNRLRTLFDDELFIRRSHGMEPTARAIELEAIAAAIIDLSRQALAPGSFDLAETRALVRIGALDHHCALLAAPLLERLRSDAPMLKVSFRPLTRRPAVDAMLSGRLDLAIGMFWNLPDTIERISLWQEDYAVVASKRFRNDDSLTLEEYLAARHLLVSIEGDLTGVIDKALAEQGRSRNVIAAVPYFLAALAAAARTDAVVTLPLRLAQAYAEPFGLHVMTPPLPVRRFEVAAIRPLRSASDPLTMWLFDILGEIAAELHMSDAGGDRFRPAVRKGCNDVSIPNVDIGSGSA